ncbi:MAG: sigma-70 family RNA polymerase sigma factor [Hormoscilla sp.]
MQLPEFPECNHTIIKSLFNHSDRELLTLFQLHPECGRYFTAIFCRYYPIVYTLISQSARSPVQADYLFALTWRHIFHELRGLDLRAVSRPDRISENKVVTPQESYLRYHDAGSNKLTSRDPIAQLSTDTLTLQNWLIDITAICINRFELPPVESIYYSLEEASPPLWCYLEQALEQVPPGMRLIILMAQTFHWSETRISAYLQAEGEMISPANVKMQLIEGYQLLLDTLPADIREIYLQSD